MRSYISVAMLSLGLALECAPSTAHALTMLFSEDFDGLALGPPVDETWPFPSAFTHTPPSGWIRDASSVPGVGDPDLGVTEWEGWSFANKKFWIDVSGGEGRELFTRGVGTVAVADSDEWNDLGDPANTAGFYRTLLRTPTIDISSAAKLPLKLRFDSSWRGGCCDDGEDFNPNGNNQTAVLTIYTDVGPAIELFRWESAPYLHPVTGRPSTDPSHDPNPNYKEDALDEEVLIDLRDSVPEDATEVAFELAMSEAGDDGWWAVDNAAVFSLSTILGDMNINDVLDPGDFGAFALGLRSTSAYRSRYYGEFPVTRGSPDSIFDFDDINWFLGIMDQNGSPESFAELLRGGAMIPEPGCLALASIAIALIGRRRVGRSHATS